MKSNTAKLARIFTLMEALLSVLPTFIVAFDALFISENIGGQKILTASIIVSLVFFFISSFAKFKLTFIFPLLMMGISFAIDNIQNVLLIIVVCEMVNSLIIAPIGKSYRLKNKINKQIDTYGR